MSQQTILLALAGIALLLLFVASALLSLGVQVLRRLVDQVAEVNRTFSGIEARLRATEEALLSVRRTLEVASTVSNKQARELESTLSHALKTIADKIALLHKPSDEGRSQ